MRNFDITKLLLSLILVTMFFKTDLAQSDTIDFDELALDPNSFFDGHGPEATTGHWSIQSVLFNTSQFGPGWSYSNVNDTTTPGFVNQFAAFTGTDASGTGNYVTGAGFDSNGAFFDLPNDRIAKSLLVTNTTYAALSMLNGDGFAKKFGGSTGSDPDFFKVIFTGFSANAATGNQTGAVEFYLADYRFTDDSQDFIVDSWTHLDLSTLGSARSIGISFESSDFGKFGINTPTYVAIDNLELTAAPEPSAAVGLGLVAVVALLRRRRFSK